MKKIEILYREICKKYFPRWKPWKFTFNCKWGESGYCNTYRKHLYFGDISSVLIIHEICHAVSAGCHGKPWQLRMLRAAETARKYDMDLSEKLNAEVEKYLNNDNSEREEMEALYNRIYDAFYGKYKNNEPVKDFYLLKYYLNQLGIRKEWDEKQFEKLLKRGTRIAAKMKKELAIRDK